MMYSLVAFENNENYVCPTKNLTNIFGSQCIVKYKDGARYPAKIITTYDSKEILSNLSKAIQYSQPKVVLIRCPIPIRSGFGNFFVEPPNEQCSGENIIIELIDQTNDSLNDPSYLPETEGSTLNDETSTTLNGDETIAAVSTVPDVPATVTLNPPKKACKEMDLVVPSTDEAKRKKALCAICYKLQSNLSRHLVTRHRNHHDVQKFIHLTAGSRERAKFINVIRKRGNYIYNTDPQYNQGDLIVSRRPRAVRNRTVNDYGICNNCYGTFSFLNLRNHIKHCDQSRIIGERNVKQRSARLLGRVHECANESVRNNIFPKFRDDPIIQAIRYDELIIRHANWLTSKLSLSHQEANIRSDLRKIGRLLLAVRKITNNINLKFIDLYVPEHSDSVIEAIKMVSKYNTREKEFKTPNVASSLVTIVKHVGATCKTVHLTRRRPDLATLCDQFLHIFNHASTVAVNKIVHENMMKLKRRKTIRIPSDDDVTKLFEFLDRHIIMLTSKLDKSYESKVWSDMAKVILAILQVFNRRRAGEIERVLLEDYKNHEAVNLEADHNLTQSLSQESIKIAQTYICFMIRGKRNRQVPVLVSKQVQKALSLLLKYRAVAGVPNNNPYLFGLPGKEDRYFRACDVMRTFSVSCGAKDPLSLRGTTLRKHVATRCATYNLRDHELQDLASFMGHAEAIHKEIYRVPDIQRQILNVSQLLESVRGKYGHQDDSSSNESDSELAPKITKQKIRSKSRSIKTHRKQRTQFSTSENPANFSSDESDTELASKVSKKQKVNHSRRSKNTTGSALKLRRNQQDSMARLRTTKTNSSEEYVPSSVNSDSEKEMEESFLNVGGERRWSPSASFKARQLYALWKEREENANRSTEHRYPSTQDLTQLMIEFPEYALLRTSQVIRSHLQYHIKNKQGQTKLSKQRPVSY